MEEHERRRNSRAFSNRSAIHITPSGCAEKAEIVTVERRGTQLIYSLNLSTVQEIYVYMTELFEVNEEKGAANYELEKC